MRNEKWKWIPGYEGYYEISNLGRCRRRKRNGEINYLKTGNVRGYQNITISMPGTNMKSYYVHRIMGQVWLPPREDYDNFIEHIDGDRTNNCVDNLRWNNRTNLMRKSFKSGGHSKIDYGRGNRYFKISGDAVVGVYNSPSLVYEENGLTYYYLLKAIATGKPDNQGFKWIKLNFK